MNIHFFRKTLNLFLIAILLTGGFLIVGPVKTIQAAPGVDGSFTVSVANTILNRYSSVTTVSGNTISVNNISDLNDGNNHYNNDTLSTGDMILVYQAQGASFSDTSNSATWGAFTYNSAGSYEFAVVVSISGNDIIVDANSSTPYSCGGISNTYNTSDGNVQVVRVPQYTDLTINTGASVIANDWNGSTGGIVALVTQNGLIINGAIDVTGQGFRGGSVHNNGASGQSGFRSTLPGDGADKGEGILGYQGVYDTNGLGRYGRGAPANGGGGGVGHNSAGGGGANGNSGGSWNGEGFVSPSDTYAQAWDLDDGTNDGGIVPGYFQGGSGGGRGGYTYSANNGDALTQGPGNAAWGGDNRRQVGGLGGRPLDNDPASRVFFGGGGGAGDINNSNAGPGGDGGGFVVIGAGSIDGTGQIIANGENGSIVTAGSAKDAPSGGGAGGSIVIQAGTVTGITVTANGGLGGGQTATTAEAEGSGGSGGGGFITLDANSGVLSSSVLGGIGGSTASGSLTEFPPNGGSTGYDGNTTITEFAFPGCSTPTAIELYSLKAETNVMPFFAVTLTGLTIVMGGLFIWKRR